MSSLPEPSLPAPRAETCPLCGAPVGNAEMRCPDCNMTMDGLAGRPPAFTRQSVWFWAGALLAIYLVVLAIVVLAR